MTTAGLNVLLGGVHDRVSLAGFLNDLAAHPDLELISIRSGKPVKKLTPAEDHVMFEVPWCCTGRTLMSACHWTNLTNMLMVRERRTEATNESK